MRISGPEKFRRKPEKTFSTVSARSGRSVSGAFDPQPTLDD
jgi:hypothetical protein